MKYDVSMPRKDYFKAVDATRDMIKNATTLTQEEKDSIVTVCYGHIGDADLHINVSVPGYENVDLQERLGALVDPFVNAFIRDHHGSINAEHGMGQAKAKYLGYSKSPEMISIMQQVKSVFDPNGIMNPYKVFPTTQ